MTEFIGFIVGVLLLSDVFCGQAIRYITLLNENVKYIGIDEVY